MKMQANFSGRVEQAFHAKNHHISSFSIMIQLRVRMVN